MDLIVIELSHENTFMIEEDTRTKVVRVHSRSYMWHKERLLNIALDYLPDNAKFVAWLDCDIIIDSETWTEDCIKKLEHFKLLQPFVNVYDLGENNSDIKGLREVLPASGKSFCFHQSIKFSDSNSKVVPERYSHFRSCACGLAWVGRRDLVCKSGFYDAMVIGSGDRMFSFAAVGRFDEAAMATKLDATRKEHYLGWAKSFFMDIKGDITYLDNDLYHLWHGDLANRGWETRHKLLNDLKFDPNRDLELNDSGVYEWKNSFLTWNSAFKEYFISRREDG